MLARNFAECMTYSLLVEAVSWPSPGLVSLKDNGSHSDMNIFTLLNSSLTLRKYFEDAVRMGEEYNCADGKWDELAFSLKKLGLEAETSMYKATNGINTHKGALFLGLLLGAGAGCFAKASFKPSANDICHKASEIGRPILEKDFKLIGENENNINSTGARAYREYGLAGIRGEVSSGFRDTLEIGIPSLSKHLNRSNDIRTAVVQTLLELIARVDDTTILNRDFDIFRIEYAKCQARGILSAGGIYSEEGLTKLRMMEENFVKMSISPGGSADLIAISLCLYLLDKGYPAKAVF